jgi:hypothetical protein
MITPSLQWKNLDDTTTRRHITTGDTNPGRTVYNRMILNFNTGSFINLKGKMYQMNGYESSVKIECSSVATEP